MDSLKNMNAAMRYIENNLTNEINFKEVAKLAYCSEYHFKRMFSFLAGISLSEYIRCRRLTLAAFELKIAMQKSLMSLSNMDTTHQIHSLAPFKTYTA